MRRSELEHHLVLVAEIERLQVAPFAQIPHVQTVAILLAEEQLRHQASFDHVRRAPFARHERVEPEVPPEIVGQLLLVTFDLPATAHVEALAVDDEDAARAAAVGIAERADVDAVGTAVDGVWTRVAGAVRDLARLDGLHQRGAPGIGFGVEHVDARGAQARDEQVPALAVRVGRPRTERRAAGVPAEMVHLVAEVRKLGERDDRTVPRRARIEVDHCQPVGLGAGLAQGATRIERGHVRVLLRRRFDRQPRRGIERRIRAECHGEPPMRVAECSTACRQLAQAFNRGRTVFACRHSDRIVAPPRSGQGMVSVAGSHPLVALRDPKVVAENFRGHVSAR
jgi:hypothetical protein